MQRFLVVFNILTQDFIFQFTALLAIDMTRHHPDVVKLCEIIDCSGEKARARKLLDKCGWHLQTAVERFFQLGFDSPCLSDDAAEIEMAELPDRSTPKRARSGSSGSSGGKKDPAYETKWAAPNMFERTPAGPLDEQRLLHAISRLGVQFEAMQRGLPAEVAAVIPSALHEADVLREKHKQARVV